VCLVLALIPLAARAEDPPPQQQEALSTLLRSLETLKASPDTVRGASQWLEAEAKKAVSDLASVETDIERLKSEIEKTEQHRKEIKDRLETLRLGRALLGIPARPSESTLKQSPEPPAAKAPEQPAAPVPQPASAPPASPPTTEAKTPTAINGTAILVIDRKVDYAKEVYPIFEKNCFGCHGPDKQKGQLRLDAKASVLKGGVNGPPILPGKGEESLLFHRIAGLGGEDQMPPKDDKLSGEEMGLIRAWIDQGADWPDGVGVQVSQANDHWSYQAPVRPDLPRVTLANWTRNPIDYFILARLEKEGLAPSPEASKETLIRRLSLDLIGLPPTVKEVDDFLADKSPMAYENLVDRLLASPHYGERWARMWLDLARYADTNGYEKDLVRSMWPWRDCVISAFNKNMPFDRFTIEQIAGDLLPGATRDQIIATGFHRNTLLNDEGGIDPEEFRIVAVKDRVDTTGAVWLGSTIGCAQCHNHKFDPFTQKEYYQFFSFFDSTKDMGVGQDPQLKLPSPEQDAEIKKLEAEIAGLETTLNTQTPDLDRAQAEWERSLLESKPEWTVLAPARFSSTAGSILTQLPDHSLLAVGTNPDNEVYTVAVPLNQTGITGVRLEALTHESLPANGPGRAPDAGFVLGRLEANVQSPKDSQSLPLSFAKAFADYTEAKYDIQDLIAPEPDDGWSIESSKEGNRVDRTAYFEVSQPTATVAGATLALTLSHLKGGGQNLGRFRLSATTSPRPLDLLMLPADIQAALAVAPLSRDATQTNKVAAHHRSIAPLLSEPRDRLAQAKEALSKIDVPATMVMQDLPKARVTHILERGNFLAPGVEVSPGVPAVIKPALPQDAPKNRLTLANWLVSKENPLTARVTVNRFWAAFFGRGLVKTSEDFGRQGDKPSHPELLDWLAVDFVDSGWNIKALHKLVVTSAAYRQSSQVSPVILERDPHNELYARGPRFRLEAELVRDNALALSGLLNPAIGGPSVFPPQPEGIWENSFTIHDTKVRWNTATDSQRYRRGIYTFIRRTAVYPTLLMFDCPNRDVCTVERAHTNTPLQALATLNDPAFVETAGSLAHRILTEGGDSFEERAAYGFRCCTARRPTSSEVETLKVLCGKSTERFTRDEKAAGDLISGCRQSAEGLNPTELASWIVVSNVLLNLDETITRG
jgi:mono/diheme cytochrome c family protein